MASEANSPIFNIERWKTVEVRDVGSRAGDCQTGDPDCVPGTPTPLPTPPPEPPPKDECCKGDQIVLMQKQNSEILTIMAVLLAMFIGLMYVMNENQS